MEDLWLWSLKLLLALPLLTEGARKAEEDAPGDAEPV